MKGCFLSSSLPRAIPTEVCIILNKVINVKFKQKFQRIYSGVVQGSCLGPLLFLMYINDVLDIFQSPVNCKLYADDVKLYTELKTSADESYFQGCLDLLYLWSVTWQLAISSKKCCIATVGKPDDSWGKPQHCLGAEQISVSDTVSDLGVTVDPHLSFSQHIEKITCKAHQRANLIHRCFASKQRDLLVKAFITYARPILEYNSPLWSPTLKKDIISIESVQRKFTKRIPGMSGLSYHSRLKALNLESLELRRLRADLLLAYKILFGLLRVDSNIFHSKKPVTITRSRIYVTQTAILHF